MKTRSQSNGSRNVACLLAAFSLASPTILSAQIPGQRIPTRERVQAEYISNIMGGINEAREGWMADATNDQLDDLMSHYASDAMVIPPDGEPLYGWDAIRSFWGEVLPEMGAVQTGLGDMDASGQMAMIGGTYSIQRRQGSGALINESGGLLTVFVQNGRSWFIRAQVFAAPSTG